MIVTLLYFAIILLNILCTLFSVMHAIRYSGKPIPRDPGDNLSPWSLPIPIDIGTSSAAESVIINRL